MEPLSANDPRTIGEFRLHAQLGAGGMGQVYLGFSPAGHAVAVKVIHQQFARDQEFLRRFSHEVAAASAVGGMYTAPVVDYDLTSATPWLATAYVPGPTLATVIHKHGALPEAALWRLAAGLAEALRAVHAKGLVHRDLKPANVLLADTGPHVIDFGISRASSSMTQLTSAGMAIGTPGYMSPEQAQVQPVGPPSDMFSLGCVLAYAATGTPPFHADNPASILYQIVGTEPDLSLVPAGLRQAIQSCLKKEPAARPTPGQLIAMISELGPATPVRLGSFWPGDVAGIIAAEQAAQTPSGLTPPPLAGAPAGGAGPVSGTTEIPGPATLEPKASVAEPGASGVAGAPGPGRAPMIADGYYAAAQRPATPTPVTPGPAQPPSSGQFPPGQATYGQVPSSQVPFGQSTFGQPAFGQPAFGQTPPWPGAPAAPYPGQVSAYGTPVPAYPGQQPYPGLPPAAGVLAAQYPPGRRNPMPAEIPPAVRNAIRLMYAGLAATALDVVLTLIAIGRYGHNEDMDDAFGRHTAASNANSMKGASEIGLIADLLGLACWILLAVATRRGHGWPRGAGTVLLGIYSIITLFILLGTRNDPGAEFTTVLVWALGVAALVPLWGNRARAFFVTWRRR